MIEQIVELFRKADESAWVEPESDGYVCIDGHFDVDIIEDWLAEVKERVWDECSYAYMGKIFETAITGEGILRLDNPYSKEA